MRYIAIIMTVCLFFITGCFMDGEKSLYHSLVDKLNEQDSFIEEYQFSALPFQVGLSINNVSNEEIQYSIVIDNVLESMVNIKAIVAHNTETKDIFPSIGVMDTPVFLEPRGENKGFILVGYLDFNSPIEEFHGEFRLYLEYIDKNQVKKEMYLIFQK